MDGPVALRTRRRIQLQYPSEALKDNCVLCEAQTDTEVRELLPQWIAQNKKQQDEFKAMSLALKIVLEQQTN
jgi:predicted secreted Zn-dependent protease